MCCFVFGPVHFVVCFRSSCGRAGHGSASAGLFALGWEGSGIVQPPQLGAVLGDRVGAATVGTDPPGSISGDIPSSRDGGCRRVLVKGAPCRRRSRELCPRWVPQPRAGTTGASDSSGGRALRSKGRAREDEPVQAWAHLVSPMRLRCLIPSCRSAPVLPTLPYNGMSQRAASRLAHPQHCRLRSCTGLLPRGRQDASPFHPDRASRRICS